MPTGETATKVRAAGRTCARLALEWRWTDGSVCNSCQAGTAATAANWITERHHTTRRISTFLDATIVVAADHPDAPRFCRADNKSDVMRPNCDNARRRSGGGTAISGEGNGRGRACPAESGAREHHVRENRAPGAALSRRIRSTIALRDRKHPRRPGVVGARMCVAFVDRRAGVACEVCLVQLSGEPCGVAAACRCQLTGHCAARGKRWCHRQSQDNHGLAARHIQLLRVTRTKLRRKQSRASSKIDETGRNHHGLNYDAKIDVLRQLAAPVATIRTA
jgi:hypothetical protein